MDIESQSLDVKTLYNVHAFQYTVVQFDNGVQSGRYVLKCTS
ncbi:hypothetical protein [Streptomyces sp. NBC_00989]|nr:hypothetical protein OG714_51890 [Streptomyces sp. NBC_00989]